MKKFFLVTVAYLLTLNSHAQDDSQTKIKHTFSIDGSVCVTTDGKSAYYNMGGAQLKFDFNHKVAVTLTLLPSLGVGKVKVLKDNYYKDEIRATPVLGIGPQIFIRKLILSFPFYYRADKKIWIATAGIGYKIQFSKAK